MLPLLLAATLALPASNVELRALPEAFESTPPGAIAGASEFGCDDGTNGGTLVQHTDDYYGNRFETACAAGRLTAVRFTYFGYGLQGDYAFRLHLFDATCHELAATAVRSVPAAPAAPADVEIDLSDLGWCVGGAFSILLEPLSCADGSGGGDCFPAIVVDATTDGEAPAHCAVVNASTGAGRQCLAARSADGRFFDFRLRAEIECSSPHCATAVQPSSWSGIKRLYHDPASTTRF